MFTNSLGGFDFSGTLRETGQLLGGVGAEKNEATQHLASNWETSASEGKHVQRSAADRRRRDVLKGMKTSGRHIRQALLV